MLRSEDLDGGFRVIDDDTANCGVGLDAEVQLIDSATGETVWAQPIPYPNGNGSVQSSSDDGLLYVSGARGWKSLASGGFAVRILDGSPVWQRDDDQASTQAVVGDVLLQETRAEEIRAIDAATGSELWDRPGSMLRLGPPPDLAESGMVFLTAWPESNDVIAVDRRTGDERWRYEADAEPYLIGGEYGLFVALWPNVVIRLDPVSGDELWRYDGIDADATLDDFGSFDFVDDRLVVTASVRSDATTTSRWVMLDQSTGAVVAEQLAADSYGQSDFTYAPLAPFAFGDLIVTSTSDNIETMIRATDPATSDEPWSVSMPVPRERLVVADSLFVIHQAPRPGQAGAGILAIGADGQVRWSWASQSLLEPLVLEAAGELVVVGLSDDGFGEFPRGGIVALNRRTGEVAWSIETTLPARTFSDTDHGLIAVTQDSSIFCD